MPAQISIDAPSLADFDALAAYVQGLESRIAALEAAGGGDGGGGGGVAVQHIETSTMLVSSLPVAPGAGYLDVASIDIGPVMAGQTVMLYGESHGNPQQAGQTENAWVTGISVYEGAEGKYHPCPYRGRDLEKNRKHDDCRFGAFTATEDHASLTVKYRMRAVNTVSGGTLDLSWVKLGAIL